MQQYLHIFILESIIRDGEEFKECDPSPLSLSTRNLSFQRSHFKRQKEKVETSV